MKSKAIYLFIALTFCVKVYSQIDYDMDIPLTKVELEIANTEIAHHFAPTIHQMATHSSDKALFGVSDLLTSVFYDGNQDLGDNWDNLDNYVEFLPSTYNELDPYVYYSVVWLRNYWIITYGFYHPRDHAGGYFGSCCAFDSHENDFEGALIVVNRGTGIVLGTGTISHHDLLVFPEDGMPEIFIDNKTHAVEANCGDDCISHINPCDDCLEFDEYPHIIYTPDENDNPFVDAIPFIDGLIIGLEGTGEYKLEDIYGLHTNSLFNLRNNPTVFDGDIFYHFGEEDCMDGEASAPWGWSQMDYSEETLAIFLCLVDVFSFECGEEEIIENYNIETTTLNEWNPYLNEFDDPSTYCDLKLSVGISENTIWDVSNDIPIKNLTVGAGHELHLSGMTLKMANDGLIRLLPGAKLIVNNSIITNCGYSGNIWKGISIPDQGDFVSIEIINQSKIQNSQFGISNSPVIGNSYWENGQPAQVGGNLNLYVSDSDFINNGIGITLIGNPNEDSNPNTLILDDPYFLYNDIALNLKSSNSSVIDLAFFLTNDIAINSYNSKNISLTRSIVANSTISGIYSFESDFKIYDDNLFRDSDRAITLNGTFPLSSGSIIGTEDDPKNTFKRNYFDVVSEGNDNSVGVRIVNNLFDKTDGSSYSGVAGVLVEGSNHAVVRNNTFIKNQTAISASATGLEFNEFSCNEFVEGIVQDIIFQDDNSFTVFLENDFQGGIPEANIHLYQTKVNSNQGSEDFAASNCFSGNNVSDILTDPTTTTFKYWYYPTSSQECLNQLPNTSGQYNVGSSFEEGEECTKSGIFNLIDPNDDGQPGYTGFDDIDLGCSFTCIKDSINFWISQVINSGSDNPLTYLVEGNMESNANISVEILDQWIRFGLYIAIQNEDLSLANEILSPLLSWKWQTKYFGVNVLFDNLPVATQILSGLPQNNQEELDFVAVQEINLLRIQSDTLYELDSSEHSTLLSIAESNTSSSGYARSLYYLLTNEFVEISIPEPSNSTNPRSVNSEGIKIRTYPIPSKDYIYVESIMGSVEIIQVKIFDVAGNLRMTFNELTSDGELNLTSFASGLYFVHIELSDGSFEVKKIYIE